MQGNSLPTLENEIEIVLKTRISLKRKRIRKDFTHAGNLVDAFFGLTKEDLEKLEKWLKKTGKKRSQVLREAIDYYWSNVNSGKKVISKRMLGKYQNQGLSTIGVTIRRDQDSWIRVMSEKAGKTMSEIGREALECYLTEKNT